MSNLCDNCECNSEIEVCADCDWRTKKYKIPKFATNGDVIKALFPNDCVKQENGDKIVFSFIKAAGTIIIDADWWDAPYKSESDKSADTFEKLLNSGFYERFRKGDEDADCD